MALPTGKMPTFQMAQMTLTPSVKGLLDDPILIEDGRNKY